MADFYRATLCVSAVFAVVRCLSVRLSVTLGYCIQTVEDIVKLISRHGSYIILVFWRRALYRIPKGNRVWVKMCNFLPLVVFQLTVNICAIRAYIERTVVSNLYSGATVYVPKCHKGFFQILVGRGIGLTKGGIRRIRPSMEGSRYKPRNGPIIAKRQSCRLSYRKRLKEFNEQTTKSYTNDLHVHEALLKKEIRPATFWRCWRSKCECNNKCQQVDGCVDDNVIVNKFAA